MKVTLITHKNTKRHYYTRTVKQSKSIDILKKVLSFNVSVLQQACTNLATALLVGIVTTSLHSWLARPFATSEFIRTVSATVSVDRQYFTVTNSVIIKTMVTQLPSPQSCLSLRPQLLPHSNPILNLIFLFVNHFFVNFMAFRVGSKPNIKPLCKVYPPPSSSHSLNLKPNPIKPFRVLGQNILISQRFFLTVRASYVYQ